MAGSLLIGSTAMCALNKGRNSLELPGKILPVV